MRWVAARWSDWLRSLPPESWHGPSPDGNPGDLFAVRAVLRVLQRLKLSEDRGFRIDHLGLRPVADYDAPVATLVATHLGGRRHCDESVTRTAAALELARWLGVVELAHRRDIEAWLRARFDALGEPGGFADRLEIARVLEDPQLLRRALGGPAPDAIPLSAAGTLRAAAAAARLEPPDIAPHFARAETADVRELDNQPLVAAAYLADLARLRAHWAGKRHALTAARPETVEHAVDVVSQAGRFLAADLATAAAPDPDTVSTETLAVLTHFPGDARAMETLARARRALPPTLTASAREEASRLRGENAEIARLAEAKAKSEALTALARRVLLVPALLAAAAFACGVAVLIALMTGADWVGFVSLPAGFALGLVAVTLLLDNVGLASPRLVSAGRVGRQDRGAGGARSAPPSAD